MSEIKVVDDKGQEIVPDQAPVEHGSLDSPALPELEIRAIGQVLGLEKGDELGANQDKLQTLLDYAKTQTEDHSLESLKWVIRNLEFKLGTPKLGEKIINYLAEYAYLSMESKQIEKEKARFEK